MSEMSEMVELPLDGVKSWSDYNDMRSWLRKTYGDKSTWSWYVDTNSKGITVLVCTEEIATMVLLKWRL